jgi:hypothetical protein
MRRFGISERVCGSNPPRFLPPNINSIRTSKLLVPSLSTTHQPQHHFDDHNFSKRNNKWSTLADVIINEIVTYLSTNERLIIWERICRNYYRSSLNGNGWIHNLQLLNSAISKHGYILPFTQLPSAQRKDRGLLHNDGNNSTLGRLCNYHRIRYLTTNYPLDDHYGNHRKWLSLTHLRLTIPPNSTDMDAVVHCISTMPILTSLTLQVEGDVCIQLPSHSTLTSITILTSFSSGTVDKFRRGCGYLSIVGKLPNLRRLTIGSDMKVNQCIDDVVSSLETLSFGRDTQVSVWRSIIEQCGSSLRILNDRWRNFEDLAHLVNHAPHLTSLSVSSFSSSCLDPIAKLTNLKHLSIDLQWSGELAKVDWQPLRSLVHLQSFSILNFGSIIDDESLISLVRYLDARNSGNGQLITMNVVNVDQWLLKMTTEGELRPSKEQ